MRGRAVLGALSCVATTFCAPALSAVQVSEVRFGASAFAPSRGEKVHLQYRLSTSARIGIQIVDPDGGIVTQLLSDTDREAGSNEETWDGHDLDGQVVPDEAYTAVVTVSSDYVYDPVPATGQEIGDVTNAEFDGEAGTLVYRLPSASRVLIRCGLHSGPMLKTLVDWKPRIAGSITEHWDGRDESQLFSFRDQPGFAALITYVTLPDATVIAYGNGNESYRDYKLGRGKKRPEMVRRHSPAGGGGQNALQNLVPPAWARAPKVDLSFSDVLDDTNTVPEVRERVNVHVDVDPSDRQTLLADQFEVIFFVDNVFFSEAERGHLPFTWPWEVLQLAPGEHILTVNISSFRGEVGVASRKVRVVKGGD